MLHWLYIYTNSSAKHNRNHLVYIICPPNTTVTKFAVEYIQVAFVCNHTAATASVTDDVLQGYGT